MKDRIEQAAAEVRLQGYDKTHKQCTVCLEILPVDAFLQTTRRRRSGQCRQCNKRRQRGKGRTLSRTSYAFHCWAMRTFDYMPGAGRLIWRDPWKRGNIHYPIRTFEKDMRVCIKSPAGIVPVDRVAHLLMLGSWPKTHAVNRSGDPQDLRWSNIKPLEPGEPRPANIRKAWKKRVSRDRFRALCSEPWSRQTTRIEHNAGAAPVVREIRGRARRIPGVPWHVVRLEDLQIIAATESYYAAKHYQRCYESATRQHPKEKRLPAWCED